MSIYNAHMIKMSIKKPLQLVRRLDAPEFEVREAAVAMPVAVSGRSSRQPAAMSERSRRWRRCFDHRAIVSGASPKG
jgi:hypothetical protein